MSEIVGGVGGKMGRWSRRVAIFVDRLQTIKFTTAHAICFGRGGEGGQGERSKINEGTYVKAIKGRKCTPNFEHLYTNRMASSDTPPPIYIYLLPRVGLSISKYIF